MHPSVIHAAHRMRCTPALPRRSTIIGRRTAGSRGAHLEHEMKAEIERLDTRVVYRNRWMTVREDQIRRGDGSLGVYGVVEKRDFAVIAAVQDEHVLLVEQYRYPVGARHWELPQGSWETMDDDQPALARAELRQETGVVADSLAHVGHLYLGYGFCTQGYDVFLATGLHRQLPELDPEEQGLLSRPFTVREFERMIRNGAIPDAATVAAFGLLRLKGLL
jgi:ADP-ribose pyrophosphatase